MLPIDDDPGYALRWDGAAGPAAGPAGAAMAAERLLPLGIEVTAAGAALPEAWLLSGNTYPWNDQLAATGASWDRQRQAWLVQDAAALGQLAVALAPVSPGLAEQAASFEGFAPIDPLQARFFEIGPHALNDHELLQLLLSLQELPGEAQTLSQALLERFGGLSAVFAADRQRLAEIDQVSRKTIALIKAIQVALERILHAPIKENPIIGSWSALIDYLKVALRHKTIEHLMVLYLDRKNRLIRDEVQQQGTVDHTPLYPREIVKRALELAASSIILVHNHPSGDPTPSPADVNMTKQVVRALEAVDITVHDHVIVGLNDYLSFRAKRLL